MTGGPSKSRPSGVGGRAELGVAAGVVALGIFVLAQTATVDVHLTSSALGPRFFPACIGLLLLGCGCWLALDVWRGGSGGAAAADVVPVRPSDWRRVALVSAAFLLHAVLIGPLGWPLAGALLFWGVAASLGSRSWARDAAVSVLLACGVFAIVTHALGVYLPGGLLDGVL
jgi:putative tricarboxylic transport membrane protein